MSDADIPPRFNSWPREDRIEYLRLAKRREQLLNLLLLEVTGEPRERDTDRVNKEELATVIEGLWSRRGQ